MMNTDVFPATAQALLRYRVVSHIQLLLDDACNLTEALTAAAKRLWPDCWGRAYGRSTIERWWYAYAEDGFGALMRRKRCNSGLFPALTSDQASFVKRLATESPHLHLSQIHRAVCHREGASARPPSYGLVRRYLRAQGFDRAIRNTLKAPVIQQAKKDAETWMLNVLKGRTAVAQLVSELKTVIPSDDVERLYGCVKNNTLLYRKRAVAALSLSKGIKKAAIQAFLNAGEGYLDSVARHYQEEGITWFSRHSRRGLRKHQQEAYKNAVFAILHSPPSAHGINRTTWRIEDIKMVMSQQSLPIGGHTIHKIISSAGYTVRKAKMVLTSNDPEYEQKIQEIVNTLMNLKPDEKFFSVDEFGPFAVKRQGGRSLMKRGETKTVPLHQESKGVLIVTAGLELSENQVTHFYSEKKNTDEMLKLLEILLVKYSDQSCLYLSWDAASWHMSKKLYKRVEEINSPKHRASHRVPLVKLAPLPSCAQFLNVIESVFSGMAKAIIHNSDYQSADECMMAIDRYFEERNQHFRANPKRAGGKIWGKELVPATFHHTNNCKDPHYGWPLR